MHIDDVLLKEMAEHGLREFPNEACGLLAGRDGEPVRFFAMRNLDASPASYRLDPKEQLQVFDRMDEEGLDLLGIFHTHTHSEAYPSETDRKLAFYPEALYLVMSLSDRERPDLRAFRVVEGEVTEEELDPA
ncbi:MAG TPA: M67 family metallopeptidase [Actinomycetota bacterium]|nr:M67 family metallopeptidase [Actinomycetota bacterium]